MAYERKKDYRTEETEPLYRMQEKLMDELSERRFIPQPEEPEAERKERIVPIIKHRAMPRLEDEKIEPLKRLPPMVIGGLFDRVRFLEARMAETTETMTARADLHKKMLEEIAVDITERDEMLSHTADPDERRNIKLDMSVLRKERRHEQVQFWRDLLELRTELRELMEKHEMEKKIVDLFVTVKT